MMRKPKAKEPTIYTVICMDVDGKRYVFETHSKRSHAVIGVQHWRSNERKNRRYEVVRYVPSRAKAGGGRRG